MKLCFSLWLIALLCLCEPVRAGEDVIGPVPSGSPAIEVDAGAIRAHMVYLADDLLEGREAGTRGDALAQLYIASQFQAVGLRPAGDAGTYLQRFRVRATRLEPGSARFELIGPDGRRLFENGGDVAVFGDPLEAEQRIESPVLFAGYGIVAPERGIDDYHGLDARASRTIPRRATTLPIPFSARGGATKSRNSRSPCSIAASCFRDSLRGLPTHSCDGAAASSSTNSIRTALKSGSRATSRTGRRPPQTCRSGAWSAHVH